MIVISNIHKYYLLVKEINTWITTMIIFSLTFQIAHILNFCQSITWKFCNYQQENAIPTIRSKMDIVQRNLLFGFRMMPEELEV